MRSDMKTAPLIITILGTAFVLSMIFSAQAAESDNRDLVHDTHGQIIQNTFGNCVRTRWTSAGDECRQMAQAQKIERRQLADEERTVYFEFNRSTLMESERHKLDSLAGALKAMDDINGVNIAGYADRIGSASYNERLSERRAQAVEQYLRERGYLKTTVGKTRWLGESSPVTQCNDSLGRAALIACLQKDRRVTVEVKDTDK
jgi:outer membrane protein OmpA-like peptidoglycan-associated protein